MFEAVIELSGVSEICRSVHTLFKTEVSKLICSGKIRDYFTSWEPVKKKKVSRGTRWKKKACIVEILFSLCVFSCRGGGPARSYDTAGIQAEQHAEPHQNVWWCRRGRVEAG